MKEFKKSGVKPSSSETVSPKKSSGPYVNSALFLNGLKGYSYV